MTVPDSECGEERGESIESIEYGHGHMDIDIDIDIGRGRHRKRKGKVRRFYVPVKFENTFDMLQSILKREGSNFSIWVRDQTERYVRLHEPGNPQQRIDTIIQLGKPYVAGQCGDCNDKAIYEAVLGTKRVFLCSFHFSRKKHKLTGWKEL